MRRFRLLIAAALVLAAAFTAVEVKRAVMAARRDGGDPQRVVSSLVPFRLNW